jgi:hypothetical protein
LHLDIFVCDDRKVSASWLVETLAHQQQRLPTNARSFTKKRFAHGNGLDFVIVLNPFIAANANKIR